MITLEGTQKEINLWKKQRGERGFSDYDTYGIYNWFMSIIPDMLEYKSEHFESIPGIVDHEYCKKHGISDWEAYEKVNKEEWWNWCSEYWKKTLKKIAFLFREADEHTCSRRNPYQEEHNKALHDYLDKYGLFGSKVKDSPYNILDKYGRSSTRMNDKYSMSNLDEYKEIDHKFYEEYHKIEAYQEKCKKKAFKMLKKYFYDL